MKAIRRICAPLLIACFLSSPAQSTSFSTDQSDLWWNAAESGWGIQFVQRGSVIFATMFVYDQNGIPFWYTATLNSVGSVTWSGALIATSGPWFGTVPFNSATVAIVSVGTMTWTAQTVTAGTLTYNVGSVAVTKNLVRQPIVMDNFSGHYGGGLHQVSTGCANASLNGTIESIGTFNITQNGSAITLTEFGATGGSCSFPGTLTQAGQMGDIVGSYACSSGDSGTFHLFEVQVNPTGITGRYTASSSTFAGCQGSGWFGGLRVTTF